MNDDLHDDGDGDLPEDDFENGMFNVSKLNDFQPRPHSPKGVYANLDVGNWPSEPG